MSEPGGLPATALPFGEQVPQFQRDVVRGQLRDQVVDLRRPALARHVRGDRGERLAAEDVLHERRQVAARPGLDEEPHAVGVHRLDHPRELDRGHPVVHGQGADRGGVGRELLAGGAAVDRRVRRGERHVGEQVAERPHPRLEQRRVVRPAERQPFADRRRVRVSADSTAATSCVGPTATH